MKKCTECFGTGSFKKKKSKKTEHCKACNGTGIIETKPRKEPRSNIAKLANQVPYFQVFRLTNHVSINCCKTTIGFLDLKIDEPIICKCNVIEVLMINKSMIDIKIIPLKRTETILI